MIYNIDVDAIWITKRCSEMQTYKNNDLSVLL